jgi:hypothetical protein
VDDWKKKCCCWLTVAGVRKNKNKETNAVDLAVPNSEGIALIVIIITRPHSFRPNERRRGGWLQKINKKARSFFEKLLEKFC